MKFSGKLVRLKEVQDEADEQLDIVKCENKNLADEISNVLGKLQEIGGSIHNLDNQIEDWKQKSRNCRPH